MASKKLLTVFGATGTQGRSVLNAVLAHPTLKTQFSLRGITRDPSKPNAQELTKLGVEMVRADMNDAASLRAGVAGSHAVFAVTNYWESRSKAAEVAQGRAIVDAAIAEQVKVFVWSALPHGGRLTGGRLQGLHHFDSKADIAEYLDGAKGQSGMVGVHVEPSFYMQNLRGMINKGPDGVPALVMPWSGSETKVPLVDAVVDFGRYVAGALAADPAKVDGKHISAVSEWSTPEEIVAQLNESGGTNVQFKQVPEDVFSGFLPKEMAEEMTENMVLVRDYSYYGVKGKEEQIFKDNEAVIGKIQTTSFKEFVSSNGPWKW
ncbi:hypothetical protein FH972_020983 [Carpinus fangiana]|uniref:NmrA-like domain-containing protein n=1 Tax=Carpinus fangiana TaxID=176857 RepID=A0A5N6KN07_9ROSI|nr:hypothetical protein FH972_020983 [Carpinus fangiana]